MKPPIPAPDDPITPEEAEAAEALRRALESSENAKAAEATDRASDAANPVADAALLASLAAAHAPRDIDERAHRVLLAKALAQPRAKTVQRGVVIRVAFGFSATIAAAAAAVIVLRTPAPSGSANVPFVARSTQELFDEPFAAGGTTARVDRIAQARASEFRDNQFARWGVR